MPRPMLLYSQTHLHNLLDRLETSDARTTGQLEALTVWVAALVQSHPGRRTPARDGTGALCAQSVPRAVPVPGRGRRLRRDVLPAAVAGLAGRSALAPRATGAPAQRMKHASPDAGRRRVLRTRRHCEGSVPGRAPLSTASLLAMAVMALGPATAPDATRVAVQPLSALPLSMDEGDA